MPKDPNNYCNSTQFHSYFSIE